METGTVREYDITTVDNGTTVTLWGPMEYGYRNRVVWMELGWSAGNNQEPDVWRVWRTDPRTARAHVVETLNVVDVPDVRAHLLTYLHA